MHGVINKLTESQLLELSVIWTLIMQDFSVKFMLLTSRLDQSTEILRAKKMLSNY